MRLVEGILFFHSLATRPPACMNSWHTIRLYFRLQMLAPNCAVPVALAHCN